MNVAGRPLEEQSLRLAVSQLLEFVQLLRAVVDLPVDVTAMGKHKVDIVTIFHDCFDELLEILLLLRQHDILAVIHHD